MYKRQEQLISLGVDRILTSGLKSKAPDGWRLLKELQDRFGDRIEILAGSGINAGNAKELTEKTGIAQVHSSCKDWIVDPTTVGEEVSYSCLLYTSGLAVPAIITLGLNIWTTNNNALYTAGLGVSNITKVPMKPMVLARCV